VKDIRYLSSWLKDSWLNRPPIKETPKLLNFSAWKLFSILLKNKYIIVLEGKNPPVKVGIKQ